MCVISVLEVDICGYKCVIVCHKCFISALEVRYKCVKSVL